MCIFESLFDCLVIWDHLSSSPFFFLRFIYLFYFSAVVGLNCCMGLLAAVSRAYSSHGAWASHCGGSLLQSTGSRAQAPVVAVHGLSSLSLPALECWLGTCST